MFYYLCEVVVKSKVPETLETMENTGEGIYNNLENGHNNEISNENQTRYEKLNLSQVRREDIGRKTKRILDAARCQFIKESIGFASVKLKYYTSREISLENVVLVATK